MGRSSLVHQNTSKTGIIKVLVIVKCCLLNTNKSFINSAALFFLAEKQ